MEISPWLIRLENRFGHWGIPHLIRSLVILNCLTFVLQTLSPGFDDSLLFDPQAVLHGEVWRVFSFLLVPAFAPGSFGMIFFLISMYFTWFIGEGLENAWGAFLLNFYMLVSVLFFSLAGVLFYQGPIPSTYIMASLLFAFATLYPDLPIMIFPLPIQIPIKYLAIFSAAMMGLQVIFDLALAPLVLASMAGYFLFVGPGAIQSWKMRLDSRRRMKKFRGDDS
ncbi:MAG: hypothetical protein PHD76_09045 [Methylacidiphilales bacterium]|nr:hypothetical protein [Candidatus Methylacidiphilales bacterium]